MYFLKQGKLQSFDAHKMPVFKETRKDDWVIWGWTDFSKSGNIEDTKWNNLQPNYYEWLYNSSSKHRAIINRKNLFICGKGLKPEDSGLDLEDKIKLRGFILGLKDKDFVKNISTSLTKIGGFCYEVIPSKNGKKIDPHFIDIENIRVSKKEYDGDGKELPPIYYYTCDWSAKKPEENPDFTIFEDWDWSGKFESNKRYLVYYKENRKDVYPIPEYTAAVPYIAADYEVGNFTLNNTKSGFTGGYLVNFYNGEPEEDQKAEIESYFKSKFTGSDNAGEPLLSFNEDKDSGVELVPLNANGQDDRFINLNNQIREEIFSGHTVDPVVVGLQGNNGFNNNADEKRTAVEDFQNYYVKGKQLEIESHINAIREFNEIKGNVYIERLDPIQPQFSSADIIQIATLDEVRKLNGLPKSSTESNAVADALGTISPLVATKVLETMTAEEIRAIVGLSTKSGGVEVKRTEGTDIFNEQKDFTDNEWIHHFAINGTFDDELEIINEREFTGTDYFQAEEQEHEFLTSLETLILKLLLGNPSMSVEEIAKVSKRPVEEVKKTYEDLEKDGKIKDGEAQEEPPELFIVYKYALRPNAPALKTESRPFCKNLMTLSKFKSWTLDDIRLMNNGQGLPVFLSRGGWYNNPDTGRTEPRCRHQWKQVLVRQKPR